MNYYSFGARFTYRLTFVAAAATYGIVVYKTWRARQKAGAKQPGGVLGYLADENIQYLGKLRALGSYRIFVPYPARSVN